MSPANDLACITVARLSESVLHFLQAEGREPRDQTAEELSELAKFGLVEIETIEGTNRHPIWSEDQQDWVPLGQLQVGETLRTADGPAVVISVTILNHLVPVYNIEVHGQHVYQVGDLGLLVHNSCGDEVISLARGEVAAGFMTRGGKLIVASKTLGHEALALTIPNLTHMATTGKAIAFTVGKKFDDTLMIMGSGRFPVPGGLTEAMKNMIRNLVK